MAKEPVALVGAETLLGRELRDLFKREPIPVQVKSISTTANDALATEEGDEESEMAVLKAADLADAKVVVLAGTLESSRKAFELLHRNGTMPAVVDLSGALEENPEARLRAPQLETSAVERSRVYVIAHPAAIALALFLRQLRQAGAIEHCVIQVFEPASERGQRGLDELQQQTVGLLSFQKLKKKVYDAQVSFNLLSTYGEDAPLSLETIELTIDRHLATLLAATRTDVPMPSLRLIQAPVFHGYSFLLWVEFAANPGAAALALALATSQIEVRGEGEEAPTNVGVVGQSGVTVGSIQVDRNEPKACWFWMVADNLRVASENAVEVVRESLL